MAEITVGLRAHLNNLCIVENPHRKYFIEGKNLNIFTMLVVCGVVAPG